MNELLKVEVNQNQEQVVSGRLLHQFLEINTPYTQWFERMLKYGFGENIDFVTVSQKSETANGGYTIRIDHTLKLNMAKELCMLARNERGKEARQYFIKCEEAWNSPEMIMRLLIPYFSTFFDTLTSRLSDFG